MSSPILFSLACRHTAWGGSSTIDFYFGFWFRITFFSLSKQNYGKPPSPPHHRIRNRYKSLSWVIPGILKTSCSGPLFAISLFIVYGASSGSSWCLSKSNMSSTLNRVGTTSTTIWFKFGVFKNFKICIIRKK